MDTPLARAQADAAATNAKVAGAPTIKIGIVTPLSGPGDPTAGELTVRGATIAADYIREHGGIHQGIQVELLVRNDQETVELDGGTMPRSAVGAFAKLAMVDEVLAAMGPWHLRYADYVADTAERIGVPLFVENAHPTITAKQRQYVFRTFTSMAERVPQLVSFIASQNMRRISILAANTVFGYTCADMLEAQLKALPGEPREIQRFDFDQETVQDLRPELFKIKDFAPDLFINVGVIRTNYLIINQAEEVGLLPGTPMMAPFQWPLRSSDYWRLAGDAGNYMVWPASQFSPTWSGLQPVGRWFVARYYEKYGMMPPDTAMNAFTDVTIIAQALELVPTISRASLLYALEVGTFDTWRGKISFERGQAHWHHSPPPVVLQQYQAVGQDITNVPIVYPLRFQTHQYLRPGGAV
ncbi:hypothetical protein Rhe02_32200 [Rhizocola hellebori]|uniref:Leucine-binding protein domain-containing protein n=1 Tax=Rhizocola hellebori TaxID=1392758 RepID=A0A8J3Q8F8_9ACTN|nr:ABC transporter substrate-binding protein [Rhizocola hellebori]GIH05153.1 hypothetical protein Rhe02_32200 [Rhizocola hellebori]